MSYSRHSIPIVLPIRNIRLKSGGAGVGVDERVQQQVEESYHKGFGDGQKALGEQMLEQRKQLLDLQNGVIRSMEQALPKLINDMERSLVVLALEAARSVVAGITIDAGLVESLVTRSLQELKETSEYEVMLHPADLALLRQVESGLLPATDNTRVKFSGDAKLKRGDCVVKTRHGSIAAVREQMFETLERAVLC